MNDLIKDLDRIATISDGPQLYWPYVAMVARKAALTIKDMEAEIDQLQEQVQCNRILPI